jgi:hypothetical protein
MTRKSKSLRFAGAASLLLFGLTLPVAALAQARTIPLTDATRMIVHKVTVSHDTFKGRPAYRVNGNEQRDVDRVVLLPDVPFHDGIIEVDVVGEADLQQYSAARGFIGIAFRAALDASTFECLYIRPTNGRADDQVRRNHSDEYISFPAYPWERMRKETPEKYESYVDVVPGEWTHLKIEVHGEKARLYVNGASQPSLIVNDLKLGADRKGVVALWVGLGTVGHFANLQVSAE